LPDLPTPEHSASPAFDLAEAVRQLAGANGPAEPDAVVATTSGPPVEQAVEESPAPTDAAPTPDSQELAQLRAELAAAREEKEILSRRSADSIDWARKGFLRKSTEAARATELLRKAATSGELDKAELERFLASGTAEAQPTVPQQSEQELMAIDASRFAFRYGLSEKQIGEFSGWIAGPDAQKLITEDDTVNGNYYQTLRNYYERYREATSKPDPAVAQAAGAIARVQKEVARAAASPPSRIMPTEAPQAKEDPMKLTAQERVDRGIVDGWFKQYAQEWMNR
jgi:hypothetical protein